MTAYITLICTSGVLNLYLCLYVFLKRRHFTEIANYFVVYASFITIYCFGSAIALMATSLDQTQLWTTVLYLGMPFAPPLGLMFIIRYLGINITKKWRIALLTIPSVTFIMVATNPFHHLHYRVFEIDPVLGAPFIHQEIGIWYMIHGVFIFSCMFSAFVLVLSRWKETAKAYRPQLVALLFGQLVPMLTAFLYLLGTTPPGVDPVPMVLWISSLLYLWAISSSRMFSMMPVAKDAIFHSINDGVIVLDESNRLIEFNQACEKMFPSLNKSMFGADFDRLWTELAGNPFPSDSASASFSLEIPSDADHSSRIYQVRISSLQQAGQNKGRLIIFTEITELKRLQEKLEYQAYYDELTHIYNRRAFFQKCEQALTSAKIKSFPFTIVLFDIDHFKSVNDTFGHYIGDQLLVHVVKACQSQINEGMLFARYGGEEFVLALTGMTASEGMALADQIRRHVGTQPLITAGEVISVTLSGGVAEASSESEETIYQLLNKADKALYSAKRAGRNQVHRYRKTQIT